MREWQRLPAEAGDVLPDVYLPDDSRTRALIRGLAEQNKLILREQRHGLSIETTSYVGKVDLGTVEITIVPKLSGLPLLRLLRYAYGLHHLDLHTDTDHAVAAQTFQDLLILALAGEAERLLSRGLRRDYVRRDLDLASPRGRINISAIAGGRAMGRSTLPCIVHEREEDTPINRVLRAGLVIAARQAADPALRTRVLQTCAQLDASVSPIGINRQVLMRTHQSLNRLTAAYQPALTLIALLWENQGNSLDDAESQVELPGFLFDMNRFFQALLSRFLSANLPDLRVEDEHRLRGLFAYNQKYNPRRQRAPTPRPDYALWRGGELIALLDAKYRDLWATPLPSEWLYQLAIYALSQDTPRIATILYATAGSTAREARIDLVNPVKGERNAQVIVRPVDLTEMDRLLAQGIGSDAARARRNFAQQLVLGNGAKL